jgi:hypothetical protein
MLQDSYDESKSFFQWIEKFFCIVPRFVGQTPSGKKAFIALGLTAGNKTARRISQSCCAV